MRFGPVDAMGRENTVLATRVIVRTRLVGERVAAQPPPAQPPPPPPHTHHTHLTRCATCAVHAPRGGSMQHGPRVGLTRRRPLPSPRMFHSVSPHAACERAPPFPATGPLPGLASSTRAQRSGGSRCRPPALPRAGTSWHHAASLDYSAQPCRTAVVRAEEQ